MVLVQCTYYWKGLKVKKDFNSLKRCIFYSLLVEPNWKFSYGAPCTDKKKTFFVCWSQILSALLIFAKFPIFALFPLPPCNWLRNCASDKFGHFFWHQMHHLSNTAQLWEKGIIYLAKKMLFFVHNVEFLEFLSF